MTGVNPPGADDPDLEPPPTSEEEIVERRHRHPVAELAQWYREHGLPLDVELHEWRPDREGRLPDGEHS
jgi:hypothetical protein